MGYPQDLGEQALSQYAETGQVKPEQLNYRPGLNTLIGAAIPTGTHYAPQITQAVRNAPRTAAEMKALIEARIQKRVDAPIGMGQIRKGDNAQPAPKPIVDFPEMMKHPKYTPLTETSYQFVLNSKGSPDFAVISPEIAKAAGLQALPVRIQQGYHKPKAQSNRGEGFGLVHIEAGHGEDIRAQGFQDAKEFVEYVLKNKNEIYRQEENGRYIFVVRNGRSKYAIVELQKTDDGFYGVTTAFPEKPQYVQDGQKGRALVWSGRNSQSQVGQPRSAEPATISKTSDQVVYGARAETSTLNNSTSKNEIEPPLTGKRESSAEIDIQGERSSKQEPSKKIPQKTESTSQQQRLQAAAQKFVSQKGKKSGKQAAVELQQLSREMDKKTFSASLKEHFFNEEGYTVNLHHVDIPLEETARRAYARFIGKERRFVDPQIVLDAGLKPRENFATLIKEGHIHEYSEYDNNVPYGQAAKLIRQGTGSLRQGDVEGLQRAGGPGRRAEELPSKATSPTTEVSPKQQAQQQRLQAAAQKFVSKKGKQGGKQAAVELQQLSREMDKKTFSARLKEHFFNEEGYTVNLHHVDIPLEEAARRAYARFIGKERRFVDPEYVLGVGLKPRENFATLIKEGHIHEYSEYDNNVPYGQPAKLLQQGTANVRPYMGELQRTESRSNSGGAKTLPSKATSPTAELSPKQQAQQQRLQAAAQKFVSQKGKKSGKQAAVELQQLSREMDKKTFSARLKEHLSQADIDRLGKEYDC